MTRINYFLRIKYIGILKFLHFDLHDDLVNL